MRNGDANNSDYWSDQRVNSNGLTDINVEEIVNLIGQKLNVPVAGFTDTARKIDIEALPGTSCSQWLQSISAVNCGFFYISNTNELKFTVFRNFTDSISLDAEKDAYTKPDMGETVNVEGFIIYGDGGRVYDHSLGADYILEINGGSLVNERTAEKLEHIIEGAKYTYGTIDKAIITMLPHVNALWKDSSAEKPFLINNISATISSCGIIASLSANQAGVGEIGQYMGQISRQVEAAIKSGERINKNCMITKYQGTIWLDDEEDE